MFDLKVVNNKGEDLTLTNNVNYSVFRVEGLNPPTATINASVIATQDGGTVNSVRVESRNIVIYIAIEGAIEENRLNLYKYFPIKRKVSLYLATDTRSVVIEGNVELIECDLFTNRQVAQISIICNKPYFKSVDELVSAFGDITPLFEFPFSIASAGTEISELTPNQRKLIVNAGEITTGVIISLFARGDVVNPTLYNVYTGSHMTFNITLHNSDELIINTNVGEKSISLLSNGVVTNALGYMSPDSEWFTLENGDNLFTYETDSGSDYLEITFRSSILYGGI